MTMESHESQILSAIAVLGEKIDNIRDDVGKLTTTVSGNGNLGLATRVDRLEQTEAREKNTKKSRISIFSAILVGFFTIISSIGGAALLIFFS